MIASIVGVIISAIYIANNPLTSFDGTKCDVTNCAYSDRSGGCSNVTLFNAADDTHPDVTTVIQICGSATTYSLCDDWKIIRNVTVCYYIYTTPPTLSLSVPDFDNLGATFGCIVSSVMLFLCSITLMFILCRSRHLTLI